LCDDDIVIEPESIERLLTFASYCVRPTLVGAHMFDLYNRTALHTMGEGSSTRGVSSPTSPSPTK
jgi:galactofuranosylgalactofuranosylrhamnosyl-N-acetylglucosaminyl-diphospho-decaprenol beta-1,5/1,6-galactofuranosyltransferase